MIKQYSTPEAYCATPDYQQWLSTWHPPHGVDQWMDSEHNMWHFGTRGQTPREFMMRRRATRLPYHLLDSLHMTGACVDIGCGHNPFKSSYPGMWGVDPNHEAHRDEQLTPEWWKHNWGKWRHAFTCNAMHYCDQTAILDQLAKVRGILAPGGTAVIALNRARIEDRTTNYDSTLLRETLSGTPGLTRMVWIDEPGDAGMDGNTWLWLARGYNTL